MGRSIGVDLHRDCFTTAILAENGRCYTREWKLKDLDKFAEALLSDDKVAVEMTTNARLFRDAVAPHVERVDVVNTRQFKVVTESVKKTDKNDAVLLARFLDKDMLPTVHMKEKHVAEVASLTRSRDTLVKQRTTLKNQVNNAFAAVGVKLRRERMSSEKSLSELEVEAAKALDALTAVEVKVLFGQIRALNVGIGELETMIRLEGSKLRGFTEITSIKGIGAISGTILLSAIDDIKRFENEGKLAAYLGIVPRVSDSNETEHRGRITKRGSKLARTALVQCALIAKRYSPYLAAFHERLRRKKGGGKANIALARKLLGIVYRTLRNGWVFADFPAFRLKDGTIPVWSKDGAKKYAATQPDLSLSTKTGKKKRAT